MLTLCRASAGSGKTYKLTLEYLKLVLNTPASYKRILAVTFTNKATAEMKRRIVEKLDILANHIDKSEYSEELCRVLQIDEGTLQERAKEVLFRLLHDFTAFNISTIDRFFQQTTRAFAREIGLQGGYNVELDNSHVMAEAIDRMLFDLEKSANRELLHWLIRYSTDKVESGKYWDIRTDIASLANELFKESYKLHSKTLMLLSQDKSILRNFQKEIHEQRTAFEAHCKACGERAITLMGQHNLTPADFKGSSRSPFSLFVSWAKGEVKEPSATFRGLANEVSLWYKAKGTPPDIIDRIETAYSNGLNECVCFMLELFETYPVYLTAIETGRYLYTLGILNDINSEIEAYEREHNLLLLSDTTELLNLIIDGSDTPFIYEKIGTYIDHYMVDEFQDTSKLQWGNLHPLFKESLDSNKENLIVGDVKQSIYRWRNSDWTLLDSGINSDFEASLIAHETLPTNWRSCRNVVRFNNSLFLHITQLLQQQFNTELGSEESAIESAYHDIYQQLPANKTAEDGHVRIEFIEPEEGCGWKEQVLEALPTQLIELQKQGVELRDIAFLVRSNSEAALIADCLVACKTAYADTPYRFDFLSDEALFVSSSAMVQFVVCVLKYLQDPHNETTRAQVAVEYDKMQHNTEASNAIANYFDSKRNDKAALFDQFTTEIEQLQQRSLFEICEQITLLFPQYIKSEGVYIQAFQDIILDYMSRHASDLNSFIAWWNDRGVRKTISSPDGLDAMRILTIHKSKGLEFRVTILPFGDWEINDTRHDTILWAERPPQFETPYPVVPIRYSSKLANTAYAKVYFEEKLHNYIDCINLAYVAFTRAKESLIIYTPKPKEKKKGEMATLSELLYASVQTAGNSTSNDTHTEVLPFSHHFDSEAGCFEVGKITPPTQESSPQKASCEASYQSEAIGDRLQLRLYSKGFFHDRKERTYGNLMHDMLSRIVVSNDITAVVAESIRAGLLDEEEGVVVTQKLQQCVASPLATRWFSPQVRVLNEAAILQPTGTFYRPDRVVFTTDGVEIIDYKFGHLKPASHRRQVSRYMELVRQMGYPCVKGYLWYIELDEVVEL